VCENKDDQQAWVEEIQLLREAITAKGLKSENL